MSAGALLLVSGCGSSDVTRARLEASLARTFANLYVQQAGILGHEDTTVASTDAHATCKKGGPTTADIGPGSDWICMIDFNDQDHTRQTGKFELQVHADSCYTAGGPSKLIGLQTITSAQGSDVTNPVFEFDACFDPHGNQ
ncbi:hypothetical protein [Prescottella agglutinans]|nr:hypothetical protein [Prescottella agglutinans]